MTRFSIAKAAVALALFSVDARARHALGAEAWWNGLDPATERAEARGVHALRPPVAGRVRIGGGRFTMGSSPAEMVRAGDLCRREILRWLCDEQAPRFRGEGMAHQVVLSSFEMDRTEVTTESYERCVSAGVCPPPGFAPGDPRFDRPQFPVTHVRWDDAATFCGWAGGRLPTEAQWEFAARGAAEREYPWGNVYNPRLCNHGAFAVDETDATDGFVGLAPVGSFPGGQTPLGLFDMAGNVAEWVSDFFDLDENGFGYSARPQVDPKGPPTGAQHVVRGGSYMDGAAWVRASARTEILLQRSPAVGFRCAYDVRLPTAPRAGAE